MLPMAAFPLATICALHWIWSELIYNPLKMEADNGNKLSIYSLSYLTWAFNSGELKQCDQKIGFRL